MGIYVMCCCTLSGTIPPTAGRRVHDSTHQRSHDNNTPALSRDV